MSFNPGGGGIAAASDVALSNPANTQVLTYDSTSAKWKNAAASGGTADATTTSKGQVQLAGDLAGTAAAPTIASGAVTSAKIADGTIVDGDISSGAAIAQSKVSGLTTALSGKAASGSNSDITSLSGLTTPLSVGQGGTGSATKNFVDLTTAQTVAGVKTFSSSPIVPTPTTATQAATKAYADAVAPSYANLPAGSTLTVYNSGSTWPARPTSRTDITVIWTASSVSTPLPSGGISGVDKLEKPTS